jgi:uncharacterized membrane protein
MVTRRQGDKETMRQRDRSQISNLKSQAHHQRGQVIVWMVFLLPLLLVLVGLVFDGGSMWAQYRRARWAADGAAVAAASDIDRAIFRDEGRVVLTENALYTAVYYAQQNHPNLHLSDVYIVDNVIHVAGWVEAETVFLGMFGVGSLRLNVHGQERPAWGISHEGE